MAQITTTLRRIFSEINYADRRSLELRTGVSFDGSRKPTRDAHHQIIGQTPAGR